MLARSTSSGARRPALHSCERATAPSSRSCVVAHASGTASSNQRPQQRKSSGSSSVKRGSNDLKPGKRNNSSSSSERGRQAQPPQRPQQRIQRTGTTVPSNPGSWRLFQVVVPYADDPGKDDISVHPALLAGVVRRLACKPLLPASAVTMVRKSFDSRAVRKGMRAEKRWVYVLDVDGAALAAAGGTLLAPSAGQLEWIPATPANSSASNPHTSRAHPPAAPTPQQPLWLPGPPNADGIERHAPQQHPVVVVGSGPAGLFAALTAARAGLPVVVLERGRPVEERGKDIGALLVRGLLNPDSNLCYGEGGAGTWSDGKLATKIGRNSEPVRAVLQALVAFGAPESILVAGKPHLGTDRLVALLKQLRHHLLHALGAKVLFNTCVEELEVSHGRVTGVRLAGSGELLPAAAVVLAVGHSARAMYHRLLARDVALTAKPFAMGFRIEHPQALIDRARYGETDASEVQRGAGRIPVAEYKLTAEVQDDTWHSPSHGAAKAGRGRARDTTAGQRTAHGDGVTTAQPIARQPTGSPSRSPSSLAAHDGSEGTGPIAADDDGKGVDKPAAGAAAVGRRGVADSAVEEYGGAGGRSVPPGLRGVYSFCMCPGGQIVCTSTTPEELCLNGMSFSRRNSVWANSALVVNVGPSDWGHHTAAHGVLAGVAFQQEMEREAARRGGGGLVAPVQRAADYVQGVTSTGQLPTSSYRLGIKSAPMHDLFPPFVSLALSKALERFERTIPGFLSSPDALLHGIEARTSAPIRIDRHPDSLQSISLSGLYPAGEGAGYAGGIVSAAVDGMRVGEAIVDALLLSGSAASGAGAAASPLAKQ